MMKKEEELRDSGVIDTRRSCAGRAFYENQLSAFLGMFFIVPCLLHPMYGTYVYTSLGLLEEKLVVCFCSLCLSVCD